MSIKETEKIKLKPLTDEIRKSLDQLMEDLIVCPPNRYYFAKREVAATLKTYFEQGFDIVSYANKYRKITLEK